MYFTAACEKITIMVPVQHWSVLALCSSMPLSTAGHSAYYDRQQQAACFTPALEVTSLQCGDGSTFNAKITAESAFAYMAVSSAHISTASRARQATVFSLLAVLCHELQRRFASCLQGSEVCL